MTGIGKVAKIAVVSRLLVAMLAMLTHMFVPSFDLSTDLQLSLLGRDRSPVKEALSVFFRWDSAYFFDIAKTGTYSFEQIFAFFPLMPWITRSLALSGTFFIRLHLIQRRFDPSTNRLYLHVVANISGLDFELVTVVVAVIVSNGFFVLAALSLFKLTWHLTGNLEFSVVSSIMFCIQPASIFISALYDLMDINMFHRSFQLISII